MPCLRRSSLATRDSWRSEWNWFLKYVLLSQDASKAFISISGKKKIATQNVYAVARADVD